MTSEEIYAKLTIIFHDLFDDETIVLNASTTAAEVSGWDSFAHVNLLMAIETQFNIKFKTSDLEKLQSVGDLADYICSRAQ